MTVNYNTLGTSVPNWTLLQTATPSAVATVTFSGLSGYAKYRVLSTVVSFASGSGCALQLNGDSGSNYYIFGSASAGSTSAAITTTGATNTSFFAEIDQALILAPKSISGTNSGAAYGYGYKTTSVLSSITIFAGTNFTAGSIYLLGAN